GYGDVVDDLHDRFGHTGHDVGDGRGELASGGVPDDGDGLVPGRAGRQRHRPVHAVPAGHQLVEFLALGHVDVPDEVDQPLARGQHAIQARDRIDQDVAVLENLIGDRVAEPLAGGGG